MANRHWLMKSEPESFGIADLERVRIEPWSGVRNYMARNHMRAMQIGDEVLFHHSSVDPPGVAGLARVVQVGVIDQTQFEPSSPYYDPRATRDRPTWDCVDVEYVATLPHFVAIERMRADPALTDMLVLKRGMRLSVQPVSETEYRRIVELGHEAPPPPAPRRAKAKTKPKARAKAKPKRTKPKPRPKRKPKR